jgi:hypothetical protein
MLSKRKLLLCAGLFGLTLIPNQAEEDHSDSSARG